MDRAKSKRLVIDADIIHSAGGEEAVYSRSKHCRDFLKAVLTICHRVVRTPAIAEEWHRHCSAFSRKWQVWMNSKKKMEISPIDDSKSRSLLHKVETSAKSDNDLDAIRKDIHLIHAALAADHLIVSCDETARKLFANASATVSDLSSIAWVNPDRKAETPIEWLENGAEAEPDRLLAAIR
jgi:hypothetical protein